MNKLLLIPAILLVISCKEVVQSASVFSKKTEEPVPIADNGSYFSLPEDGVSIYLPKSFERYSISQYQEELAKIDDSIAAPFTGLFLNLRDKLKGNFYLFYDKDSHSFCAVNSIGYIDFNRQDAKYMLAMIRKSQQEAAAPDRFFEKITASYSATKDVKLFKAVFKLSNFDESLINYRHIYMLTSKNKQTFQLIFNTPFEADIDPFIRRMKL